MEFRNPAGWYGWAPQEDDQIVVTHNGYDSGIMYVATVVPADGRYRIVATSLPCRARAKRYQSFARQTVAEIMNKCAMATGMSYRTYGGIGSVYVPYVIQNNESCAAFLGKLLKLEGAVLKCVNGTYAAIGVEYAQSRTAAQGFSVYANQKVAEYCREGTTYKAITVISPYGAATAEDNLAPESHQRITVSGLPVMDDAQAARWARGKLLAHNRKCESVRVQMEYNPGLTAMERVDITGDTDATGQWVVDTVEHDLINMTSTMLAYRCLRTVH